MKPDHEALKGKLKNYEGQLRGITSYIKELKDRAAEHGTDDAHYEVDLVEAEHNAKFYEGELARIREVIEERADDASYLVYRDDAQEWRWQLRAANGRIIADSGEGYRNKQDCLHAINLVKESKDAPVQEKQ